MGRVHFLRKIDEGKTRKEALRALKRRISDAVYRQLVEDASGIARAITRAVVEAPGLPSVRIGLAAGELLVREGDVFGPTVNRAARIVALAEPGRTLVDAEVASRLGTGTAEPLGTRSVPGFDVPLELFRLADS